MPTLMRRYGLLVLCVRWQIVTLPAADAAGITTRLPTTPTASAHAKGAQRGRMTSPDSAVACCVDARNAWLHTTASEQSRWGMPDPPAGPPGELTAQPGGGCFAGWPGGGGPQMKCGSGRYRVLNGSRLMTSPVRSLKTRVTTMSKPSAPADGVQSGRSTYSFPNGFTRV